MSLDNFVPQLNRPTTVEQLSKALGVASDVFRLITNNVAPEDIYRRHVIPKRFVRAQLAVSDIIESKIVELKLEDVDLSNFRIVWEAQGPILRHAHKSVARSLERFLSREGSGFPHPAAFGYIKGKSTRSNARMHIGARRLLSADIKDFFPSITAARVESALETAGINQAVAGDLARFLTISGSLPLGLNSSPLIANLVATPLDNDLSEYASSLGLVYSRYADDVTLSGDRDLPDQDALEKIFNRHFFRINKAKFRTSTAGQKHYVTGLSVADKVAPHAPRSMKRRLRQELYFIEKHGFSDHIARSECAGTMQHNVNRLDGTVTYVSSIEPGAAIRLRSKWIEICAREDIQRSYEPRPAESLRRAHWFVDETEIQHPDGTKLIAICLAEILDPSRLSVELVALFAEEAGDAFGTADSMAIIMKGLHWADATWSQREAVVKVLAASPIRAMVAIASLPKPADYETTYIRLLNRILSTSLRTADDASVALHVEKNRSKIRQETVRQAALSVYSQLEDRNERRPLRPPRVDFFDKGQMPTCCVPDIFLGALHRYVLSRNESIDGSLTVTLFERLRNSYSVVFDEHSGCIYNRSTPLTRW